MAKRNEIVRVEWRTRDLDRLQRFCHTAFDWKFREISPGRVRAKLGGKALPVYLVQIAADSPARPGITCCLGVKNLETAEKRVREGGGELRGAPESVHGAGRYSLVADPDGNELAVWQSEKSIMKLAKKAKKREAKASRAAGREPRKAARSEKGKGAAAAEP